MAASDATLLGRLPLDSSGDELRELYRRYSGELYGFALSALDDRQLAEEVVQDVFARAWSHAADYDSGRGSVRTWLYAITRNRIVTPAAAPRSGPGWRSANPAKDRRSSIAGSRTRCFAGRSRRRSPASPPSTAR